MKSARARQASVLAAVKTALAEHQPHLEIREESPRLIIEGLFVLSGPEGTFDHFEVKIEVDANFPLAEPKVIETAGRIPHRAERHVNADGSCCLGVWERWLIDAEDTSFGSFLKGPAHDFFLSQWFFENTGKWRLGERPHGTTGMLEAYAEVLGVKPKKSAVVFAWCYSLNHGPKVIGFVLAAADKSLGDVIKMSCGRSMNMCLPT